MATNYFWDEIEDNVVREYNENNNTIANYTTEPTRYGSVLSQEQSGETRFYHFDGQGNTTELTNESGNVTDTRRYSAFGQVTHTDGATEIHFTFQGKYGYYHDNDLSQTYVRHRFYAMACGRWTSPDPATVTDEFNYVDNNPLNGSDPTGRIKIIPISDNLGTYPNGKLKVPYCKGDIADPNLQTTVKFLLDTPAICAGYIVQMVEFSCKELDCPCDMPPWAGHETWRYWEIWEVKKGAIYADPTRLTDDTFEVEEDEGGCGIQFLKGTVDFYCKGGEDSPIGAPYTGDLSHWRPISHQGKDTCGILRGSNFSPATTDPEEVRFWSTEGGIEKRDVHTLGTKYKCCCDEHVAIRVATPLSGKDVK